MITQKLRALPTDALGLMGHSVIAEAIDEIERLRSEVLLLEREKSYEGQYQAGRADAQEDMRRALGLET